MTFGIMDSVGHPKIEVTLEMGCEKTVHSQQTMAIYGQNKQSLFDFLEWFETFNSTEVKNAF